MMIHSYDGLKLTLAVPGKMSMLSGSTGGPHYMREIGTPKIGSHIMNSNIKRPRMTVN
jgi:hypothetical protein